MQKICIDAKQYSPLLQLHMLIDGFKPKVDLTEGNVYNCKICDCGEHYIVCPDDAGDEETYEKERFADVPDISEIDELLKFEVRDTYA